MGIEGFYLQDIHGRQLKVLDKIKIGKNQTTRFLCLIMHDPGEYELSDFGIDFINSCKVLKIPITTGIKYIDTIEEKKFSKLLKDGL